MHILTCDQNQKDAPSLCNSESYRMTMPNRVKHEIFGKQVFRASNKKIKKWNNSRKNLTNPEIFITLDLDRNNGAKHSQTEDNTDLMTSIWPGKSTYMQVSNDDIQACVMCTRWYHCMSDVPVHLECRTSFMMRWVSLAAGNNTIGEVKMKFITTCSDWLDFWTACHSVTQCTAHIHPCKPLCIT